MILFYKFINKMKNVIKIQMDDQNDDQKQERKRVDELTACVRISFVLGFIIIITGMVLVIYLPAISENIKNPVTGFCTIYSVKQVQVEEKWMLMMKSNFTNMNELMGNKLITVSEYYVDEDSNYHNFNNKTFECTCDYSNEKFNECILNYDDARLSEYIGFGWGLIAVPIFMLISSLCLMQFYVALVKIE